MKDPMPEYDAVPVDDRDEIVSRPTTSRRPADTIEEIVSSAREFATKIPGTITRAIERAVQAGEHSLLIRVDDDMLRHLDMLVEAGVFKSRAESAAFLIAEGIKGQQALFDRIRGKISEINRLRAELRTIVTDEPGGSSL